MADYFYDAQIRRFIIQFAKILSQWHVTRGKDAKGNDIIVRIPVMYGDSSRMASTILANNSASSLPSAPLITYWISGLEYDQKRTQEPFFIEKMNVRQRKYNSDTNSFDSTQGQAFTIERPMPVPYTLRMTMDLWTTNYNQKLEFAEQFGTLFNPSLEIQSTDNFIDWTSLSVVYQDGLTFSSRQVPAGTNNNIDILTWKFYMPIWISQPIKLKKLGVVNKIIASIHKGTTLDDIQNDDLLMGTRQKITPYGYKLLLLNNTLQVYPNNTALNPPNSNLELPTPQDTRIMWGAYLSGFGKIRPGISQIWLQNPYMETEIVGTIVQDPLDDRLLLYSIDADTLPQDTLTDVTSVINPLISGPGAGLATASAGQRYLIVEDIGNQASRITIPGTSLGGMSPQNDMRFVINSIGSSGNILSIGEFEGTSIEASGSYIVNLQGTSINAQLIIQKIGSSTSYSDSNITYTIVNGGSGFNVSNITAAWGNLVANANDIIEYDAGLAEWIVSFNSVAAYQLGSIEYVTNTTTGVQYRYTNGEWMKSYEGWYLEGDHTIVI
jgi:hypothetical protein